MRHRVQRHQPSSRLQKKNLYDIILCTTTIRSYFPVVYKIAEEPNIHQEQSKARAGACLFGSLARRPDVPNRTRCLFRRASGQKKEEEEEPPSSNTQDNCLVLPDEEKKRWRGEREARVGPCENEWGHCQIRVRVIHHKHNTHTPALEVGVVGRRHFFVFVFFFFPCVPEKPFRIYKEGGGTCSSCTRGFHYISAEHKLDSFENSCADECKDVDDYSRWLLKYREGAKKRKGCMCSTLQSTSIHSLKNTKQKKKGGSFSVFGRCARSCGSGGYFSFFFLGGGGLFKREKIPATL